MDYPDPPQVLPPALITTIPAGTSVWQIHHAHRGAADLNPTPRPRARAGGRFDGLDGSYAYLYLGDSPAAAVAETLCRNLPTDQSPRLIPRAQITGRVLSELRTARPVRVVDLTGTGAARINAGVWLTKCDPSGYLHTRRWAAAVLAAHPDVDGIQYRPRHDENTLAWMLTASPTTATHPAVEAIGGVIPLDSADGHYLLGALLIAHNAALAP
ncbi:RES family NAD+ phosphorylase [Rhodococcus sp. PSBB049]|uniref:RES family NAD+ phosphorylase n=1 Tax=Rhodococcus sp. PSBB049 TaxID=2812863 RepID=UPI0019821B2F|nr:RES family NAD+ phosphorylase [Rhodococcus sp. PSBB049]QSE72341.1 RES family NAD+ phosphorylase [Rhodococcus sp. PSBB049]